MATPKFTSGASTLEFVEGVHYPSVKPFERMQVRDRTAAGGLQVEDIGVMVRTINLKFDAMTGAVYAALLDWFENIAEGALNSFTYHDETGATYMVLITTNPLSFPRTGVDRYRGEIELEVVG